MEITNKIIIGRIKSIRKSRGLTQVKMAEMLNISKSTYNRIEIGEVPIYNDRLNEIARILGIPLFQLIFNDYEEEEIIEQINTDKIDLDYLKELMKKQIEQNKKVLKILDSKSKPTPNS